MDAYFNQFMKDREQFLHLVAILESDNCQLIVSSGAFSKMAAITIYNPYISNPFSSLNGQNGGLK